MAAEELPDAIGDYDAIVIRSATKLTADLIERADRLKVIGRAGIGVDNVDVPAATKRGIIVANAPESNIVAAAEHTIAMLLAQVRNIPQAHASLKSRQVGAQPVRRRRGLREDARHPRLRPDRPAGGRAGQELRHDGDRLRPVRGRRALPGAGRRAGRAAPRSCTSAPTSSRSTCRRPTETLDYVNAEAFARMKDGVRIVNCARGELVDLDALGDALESGKVGGREPRRVPGRAGHGASDLRLRERGRDSAPGRLDSRGAGPRRGDHRRAGGGRAERRAGLERGQHPEGRQRGHGGAGAVSDAVRRSSGGW